MTFLPSVPALLSSPGCCRARSAAGRAGGAGARRPGPWMCPGVCRAPRHTPPASPAAPGKKAGQDGGGGTEECALQTREKGRGLVISDSCLSRSHRLSADTLGGALPRAPGTRVARLPGAAGRRGVMCLSLRSALQT